MYLNTCCGKYVAWRILPVCYGGGVREKIYCFLHRVFPINIYIYIYIYIYICKNEVETRNNGSAPISSMHAHVLQGQFFTQIFCL